MSITINNEYLTKLNYAEILNKNAFFSVTMNGQVALMVRNEEEDNSSVSFINVYLHLKCNVSLEIDEKSIGIFHVITCVSGEENVIEDFKRISKDLFIDQDQPKTSDEIIHLFYSLQNLFQTVKAKESRKLQIGLFGEFVSLLKLKEEGKEHIVQKWHSKSTFKHDIEIDKSTRIEIKTTVKEVRIHTFRHDQISRDNIKVYVMSNIIEESDEGISLFELSLIIKDLFVDYDKRILIEQLLRTCGISRDTQGITSNLKDCLQNCKLYEDVDLPKLEVRNELGISNIIYDIDLSFSQEKSFAVL